MWFIKMKKKLKVSYNAPTTLSFVLICFVITLFGLITQDNSTELLFSVYRSSLTNPLTYFRMVGHVFGHIGFEHFINNAMFLLMLGPMLEEKYTSKTLVKMFIITAIITGIIHCVLFGNSALCGASGIVFACIVLSSFTVFRDGEIPLSFILIVVLFIGKEIYSAITIQDNISNLTHIVGGVIGSFFGYFHNKKKSF